MLEEVEGLYGVSHKQERSWQSINYTQILTGFVCSPGLEAHNGYHHESIQVPREKTS